jgi:hypothetical protein
MVVAVTALVFALGGNAREADQVWDVIRSKTPPETPSQAHEDVIWALSQIRARR